MRKSLLTVLIVVAIFVVIGHLNEKDNRSSGKKYEEGYLIKQATWTDEFEDVFHMSELSQSGRVHGIREAEKIEIWDLNDRSVVMIYFLEGKYKGRWGYTTKGYITKSKPNF